jgi:hypothetical protein
MNGAADFHVELLELLGPQQRENQICHHERGYDQQGNVLESHLSDLLESEHSSEHAQEDTQANRDVNDVVHFPTLHADRQNPPEISALNTMSAHRPITNSQ